MDRYAHQVRDETKYNTKVSRAVYNTHDGRKLTGRKKKTKGEKEVRWVDGKKVVLRKGQKKILVPLHGEKEDWDGGSRGKVKSKGKRGVGWH